MFGRNSRSYLPLLVLLSYLLAGCEAKSEPSDGADGFAGSNQGSGSGGTGSLPAGCISLGRATNKTQSEDAELGAGDLACYEVIIPAIGTLDVVLADLSATTVAFGVYYDRNRDSELASEEQVLGLPSRDGTSLSIQLEPSNYFIRVNGGPATYRLKTTFSEHVVAGPDEDPLEKPVPDTHELDPEKTHAIGGYVGRLDPADYYRIEIANNGTLDVVITDLTGTVAFGIVKDENGDGEFTEGEQIVGKPSRDGLDVSAQLEPGTYFVRVVGGEGTYTLKTTFTPHPVEGPAEDPLSKPDPDTYELDPETTEAIGGYVGQLDPADYYRIEIGNNGTLEVVIADLTGTVAFGIVEDKNRDGEFTEDEQIIGKPSRDGLDVSAQLVPGTYFVRVIGGEGTYTLKTSFASET